MAVGDALKDGGSSARDRKPMEDADELGHRFWRYLPYGRQSGGYLI